MADKAVEQILLCGFMGCGKTSVGQALAFRLKWKFLDTDALIEKREGITIPEIFAQKGELYFRMAETEIAKNLARQKKSVVSTGGGFLTKEENIALLKNSGTSAAIVYLQCDFQTCYERICDSTRPLVSKNTEEQLEELFQKRTEQYKSTATALVNNSGLISDAVEEILEKIIII